MDNKFGLHVNFDGHCASITSIAVSGRGQGEQDPLEELGEVRGALQAVFTCISCTYSAVTAFERNSNEPAARSFICYQRNLHYIAIQAACRLSTE